VSQIKFVIKVLFYDTKLCNNQQILSDPRKEDNKAIITYNFATGEKEVIHEPSNSRDSDFCSSSVAIRLVSGCLPSNASAASLVTLSSPMDKIMLYLFLPLLFRFKA
jgi:hypothetical protein